MIGKAIIKTHIQVDIKYHNCIFLKYLLNLFLLQKMIFIIVTFSANLVEFFLKLLERNIPFLKNHLSKVFEKQKKILHSGGNEVNII